MIHNIQQIRDLQAFMSKEENQNLPYDKVFNNWMNEMGISIQNADTVSYYIQLMPIIERRLKSNV